MLLTLEPVRRPCASSLHPAGVASSPGKARSLNLGRPCRHLRHPRRPLRHPRRLPAHRLPRHPRPGRRRRSLPPPRPPLSTSIHPAANHELAENQLILAGGLVLALQGLCIGVCCYRYYRRKVRHAQALAAAAGAVQSARVKRVRAVEDEVRRIRAIGSGSPAPSHRTSCVISRPTLGPASRRPFRCGRRPLRAEGGRHSKLLLTTA